MVGQNIDHLRRTVAGMRPSEVGTAAGSWRDGAESLERIRRAIDGARSGIKSGFGADTQVAEEALLFLSRMEQVIVERRGPMTRAADALDRVAIEMSKAKTVNGEMPDSAPGPAPTISPAVGAGETRDEITALKIYLAQSRSHDRQVTAYGDSDEQARQQVEKVNREYDEAITVLQEIHGEPDPERPAPTSPGGPGGPGFPIRPPGGTRDPDLDPIRNPNNDDSLDPDDLDNGDGQDPDGLDPQDPGEPTDPSDPELLDPVDPGDPNQPVGPVGPLGPGGSTDPGWGGSINPGAAAGAGVLGGLGGLGVRNLLGGSGGAVTVPGQQVARPIGATGAARGAGSSVLGSRGAGSTGVPGQATGRGTGARGAGRAAGGGRGASSGRAAQGIGAAGGRGGRKDGKDTEGATQRYEVDEDWTEDDGQYPGVIE